MAQGYLLPRLERLPCKEISRTMDHAVEEKAEPGRPDQGLAEALGGVAAISRTVRTVEPAGTAGRRGEMLAAVCLAGGGLRLERLPVPEPGPGELRLALLCSGLCGTDLWKLRQGTAEAGAVLGHEVVGRVEALGPGVVGFAAGDRVAVAHHSGCGTCVSCREGQEPECAAFRDNLLAPGGFCERLVVREPAVRAATFGLPPGLPDEAAVFLEPAACVLRSVRRAGIGSLECAAVLGAGSSGLLHLLVLKALRPDLEVVVCDPLDERLELARRLGADAATSPGEDTWRAVDRLSGGRGAGAVFDTAGGAAALGAALGLGASGGTVVLFAHAAAGEQACFDCNKFWKHERRLVAAYSSGLAERREAHRLLVTGALDPSPLASHRLPLARIAEAIELAASRRALKVLLLGS